MPRRLSLLFALLLVLGLTPAAFASPVGPAQRSAEVLPGGPGEVVPGSFIVTLDTDHPSMVARQHAQRHGAEVRVVYQHALQGYAANLSPRAVEALLRDPRVRSIEQETIETLTSGATADLPTGVQRVGVDELLGNFPAEVESGGADGVTVDVPIAVLDSGIAEHPDLNLGGSVDCTGHSGGRPFDRIHTCVDGGDDTNGHGTHVAGTIGARDNGSGVVGVAPGAELWSVKVCVNSCPTGAIIAGIDWIAGQKAAFQNDSDSGIDFAAANFSITSADSDASCEPAANATHEAICGLVDTGVVFVMAAGNDNRLKVPYPVALSVSAIADFDGLPGGHAAPTCRTDGDDTLANFSNYGSGVRIAAPGVCIRSTWNDGDYATISGTSMAAPHVAGAVALYLHQNKMPPASDAPGVAGIEAAIIGAAIAQGEELSYPIEQDSAGNNRLGGPLLAVATDAFRHDSEPAPNLTVTQFTVEPATETLGTSTDFEVASGTSPTVTVEVSNDGDAPASTTTVTLTITDSDPNSSSGTVTPESVTFETVAGGSAKPANFTWDTSGLPAGSYELEVRVTDASGATVADEARTVDLVVPGDEEPGDGGGGGGSDDVVASATSVTVTYFGQRQRGPWSSAAATVTVTGAGLDGVVITGTWDSGDFGSCALSGPHHEYGSFICDLLEARNRSGDYPTVSSVSIPIPEGDVVVFALE